MTSDNDIVTIAHGREEFGPLDDGYQYYFPSRRGGLSASNLRALADELDRLNYKWNEQFCIHVDTTLNSHGVSDESLLPREQGWI